MSVLSPRMFLGSGAAVLGAGLTGGLLGRVETAEPIKLGAVVPLTGRFSHPCRVVGSPHLSL